MKAPGSLCATMREHVQLIALHCSSVKIEPNRASTVLAEHVDIKNTAVTTPQESGDDITVAGLWECSSPVVGL